MKRLLQSLGTNRGFFGLTLLIGIVYSAVSVCVPTFSGHLVTAVVHGLTGAGRPFALFLLFSALQAALSQADFYLSERFKVRQRKLLRSKAFTSFSGRDALTREQAAAFESFLNNDIPDVTQQYFLGTIDILKCISILLFSAVSLLSIHWLPAVLIISISCLIVYLPQTMRAKGGEARQACSVATARYNTGLQSFLGGLLLLKPYRYRERAVQLMEKKNDDVAQKECVLVNCQLTVHGLTAALQTTKTVAVLLSGVWLIAQGSIEIGSLIAILQLAEIIAAPIEVLAYLRHSRNEVLPLLDRYEAMLGQAQMDGSAAQPWNGNFHALTVENLSCQIGELSVLKNVNATFEAGKKYLITGPSGSGKSTLLHLLARVGAAPHTGRMLLDGRLIESISQAEYAQVVCPVFQQPYLFHATLQENILLGRAIPHEIYLQVIDKLRLSYLLERCKDQELTPEMVESLSGGEKQRVALARAMVTAPRVYLLDEVTSALDPETARLIEQLMLDADALVIHVAHKAGTASEGRYDGVFVMENGVLRQK